MKSKHTFEDQLQVIRVDHHFALVTIFDGLIQDVLGDPPEGTTFLEWETNKHFYLSNAATWFSHLPFLGYFIFEGKDYDFGPHSENAHFIEDYGRVVTEAYNWLTSELKLRGWLE
jgi:hypothetical protein